MTHNLHQLYCNPLPIPAIPEGRGTRSPGYAGPHWREIGDPTVIRYRDAWYLFPSCGMLWKSTDFVHWQFHRINLWDVGWAPTVAEWRGKLYLTASWEGSRLWCADDPLGEWRDLGPIRDCRGNEQTWCDPMLFPDPDDGKLYAYYSLGPNRGIYGVPLDDDAPCRFAAEPTHCFAYNPAHVWERFGEHNQNAWFSHLEGAFMSRANGRYYLQYSSGGAEWRNYSVGCYIGESPLGPFRPQRRNPVLIQRGGLLNGCAHHTVTEGPDGGLWAFYTVLFRRPSGMERRIAMDPVRFDENGELYVDGPSETPRFLDGSYPPGLAAVTHGQPVAASSEHPDYPAHQAVDNYIRSAWKAAVPTLPQTLEIDLQGVFTVSSARLIFRESDCCAPLPPAVFRFCLEGFDDSANWRMLADCRNGDFDGHIRFIEFPPERVNRVRLRLTGTPSETVAGVVDFAVFGTCGTP